MHKIETNRLVHQQIKKNDIKEFSSLLCSRDVLRYCFDAPTDDEINSMFSSRLPLWNINSSHWLCLTIRQKNSGTFIGITGLKNANGIAEVGFMFVPLFFGQGYGTESLIALTGYAKDIGLKSLTANITKGNIGSIRVAEKSGFILTNESANAVSIDGKLYNNLEYRIAL